MDFRTPNVGEVLTSRGISLPIPPHDYEAFTFVAGGAADDDDVATITFYQGGSGGVAVGKHTYTYVGSTNNIVTAKYEVNV